MMSGRAVAIAAVASGAVTAAVVVRPVSRVLYGRPGLASSPETAAWRPLPEALALSERQRIACDLPDGLAQELAYLQSAANGKCWSRSRRISRRPRSPAGR
jgi:signal transduction histidine kinase